MEISYDYYRVFYYVAKYKNFTKAAAALLNNQPNITRIIKNLEQMLGCPLFIRSKRGVTLTPEGEKLYAHIAIAFEHIEAAEQAISIDRSLQSGMITIACSDIALHCSLLPVLQDFHKEYPKVRIRLSSHTTPEAIDTLKMGLADLAVVSTPLEDTKSLHVNVLQNIQDVPVCSADLPIAQRPFVTFRELSQYPLISLGRHSASYSFYASFFEQEGSRFSPDIEVSAADQILPMIRCNLGIGIVPTSFFRLHQHSGNYAILNLEKAIPQRQICMLKRKEGSLSIAAKKLEEMLISVKNS